MIQKFLILAAVCFLLYAPTLKGSFTFDDYAVIVYNPQIKNLTHGIEGVIDIWNFQNSRFLTNITFAINYYIHGLNAPGYHWVNILIHFLTTLGVWYFTRLIVQFKFKSKTEIDIAFFAALLFLVHPVTTSAVSYLNQRSSALVALFYLWSVISYLKIRLSSIQKQNIVYLGSCIVFAILAILSKETAFTLPLAWVLVDLIILGNKPKRWLWMMFLLMVGAVIVFFDFHWREILFHRVYSQSHRFEFLTLPTYLLTQLQVLVVFLKLIFVPVGLNLDYDFPMSKSLLEPMTLCSMIFLSVILYLGIILRKQYWYVSFGILWFFISLISHILPPRANVIGEQKLYLTLTLLIPVIVFALNQLLSKRTLKVVLILLIGLFSSLTLLRNIQWSDPILIWEDTVRKSPNKARAHLNLGYSYFKAGHNQQALNSFSKAIELDPYVPEAYINISQIYANEQNLSESLNFAQKAVEVAPDIHMPYVQRGIIYSRLNQQHNALSDFSQALMLNPKDVQIYKMRGMVYMHLKKSQEALNDFEVWLTKNPQDIDVLTQRADIFFHDKKYELALQEYNRLIQLTSFAPYYYNRSILYEILGDKDRMQQDRQMAKDLGFKL